MSPHFQTSYYLWSSRRLPELLSHTRLLGWVMFNASAAGGWHGLCRASHSFTQLHTAQTVPPAVHICWMTHYFWKPSLLQQLSACVMSAVMQRWDDCSRGWHNTEAWQIEELITLPLLINPHYLLGLRAKGFTVIMKSDETDSYLHARALSIWQKEKDDTSGVFMMCLCTLNGIRWDM